MNPKSDNTRLLFMVVALAGFVSFAHAGPGPQFWTRTKPIVTTKDAATVKPEDAVMMVCGACKSAMIRDSKHVGPPGKGYEEWFTLGSKHKCAHCGGEITVLKGTVADSMQHDCSMCGKGAAFCCTTPALRTEK